MMKVAVLAAALAACASARNSATDDASGGGGKVDAAQQQQVIDAPGQGEFTDAPPDAHPHPDATPDAKPIDAPPDACVPVTTEVLQNPTFDLTPAGVSWQQTPIDSSYPPITGDGLAADSAPYKAWMGGFTGDDIGASSATDLVYQDITIPAGTTQLVLTGEYVVGTTETTTTSVYDHCNFALVQTNGTPIEVVMAPTNLTTGATTWTPFSHTFTTIPAGQTVRLRITSTNDVSNVTNFFFDTLSLKATHCP